MLRLGLLSVPFNEGFSKGSVNTFPFLSILADSILISNEKQDFWIRVKLLEFVVQLSKNMSIVEQAEYVSVLYRCSKSCVLVGSFFHQADGKTQFLPSLHPHWTSSYVLISTWSRDQLFRMSQEGYQLVIAQ